MSFVTKSYTLNETTIFLSIIELVQYSLIPQELLEENFLRKHKKIKKKHLDT
jgi:hypothetical protein